MLCTGQELNLKPCANGAKMRIFRVQKSAKNSEEKSPTQGGLSEKTPKILLAPARVKVCHTRVKNRKNHQKMDLQKNTKCSPY